MNKSRLWRPCAFYPPFFPHYFLFFLFFFSYVISIRRASISNRLSTWNQVALLHVPTSTLKMSAREHERNGSVERIMAALEREPASMKPRPCVSLFCLLIGVRSTLSTLLICKLLCSWNCGPLKGWPLKRLANWRLATVFIHRYSFSFNSISSIHTLLNCNSLITWSCFVQPSAYYQFIINCDSR